ncbi:MAG: hypothetical protein IJ232_09400 [Lachnospiraceae bacterium]|nr:hypothetical protein [Lachnospiraceae bacterium]
MGLGSNKVYLDSELGDKPLIGSKHSGDGDEIGAVEIDVDGEIEYIWLVGYKCGK